MMPEDVPEDERQGLTVSSSIPGAPVRLGWVPLPLDGNERFSWKLATTLLALRACRGGRATVEQLHTLVWAMNDPRNAVKFHQAWDGENSKPPLRGYVSGLLETLRVGQVEGLIEQSGNGSQKLTDKGREVVEAIVDAGTSLGGANQFLDTFAPITTVQMWRRLGKE